MRRLCSHEDLGTGDAAHNSLCLSLERAQVAADFVKLIENRDCGKGLLQYVTSQGFRNRFMCSLDSSSGGRPTTSRIDE